MKKLLTYFLTGAMTLVTSASAIAQTSVMTIHENEAVNLRRFVPKGSYSGITRLSGNTYAVVSDSEQRDGFFKFNIIIDSVTGEIQTVENIGFYSSETTGRDAECVAYNPVRKTIYVGGEKNNSVVEYDVNGLSTGRRSGNLIPGTRWCGKHAASVGLRREFQEGSRICLQNRHPREPAESAALCDGCE